MSTLNVNKSAGVWLFCSLLIRYRQKEERRRNRGFVLFCLFHFSEVVCVLRLLFIFSCNFRNLICRNIEGSMSHFIDMLCFQQYEDTNVVKLAS